MSMLKVFEMFD